MFGRYLITFNIFSHLGFEISKELARFSINTFNIYNS